MPLTTLDPLTRGSMVHEMLAEIMRAFIAQGWAPLPDDRLADAARRGRRIVTRVADDYEDRCKPPILRVWQDAVAAIRRDIHEWVRRLPDDGCAGRRRASRSASASGRLRPRRGSRREDVVLPDGTRLHGVVDLLERGEGDEWRITDYKTGRYRLGEQRRRQRRAHAAADPLRDGGRGGVLGAGTASRLYYCTDDGGYEDASVGDHRRVGEETRKAGLEVLAIIDHAVAGRPAAGRAG